MYLIYSFQNYKVDVKIVSSERLFKRFLYNEIVHSQVAELARSEMGRRLALQEGVIAAVGLVLGDEEEKESDEESEASENQQKLKKKKKENNECSLETAVQVCLILSNKSGQDSSHIIHTIFL